MQKVLPVILAGGSGSRLWPLSRENYPKQLLPLIGHHSMLQESILRTQNIPNVLPPVIVCNKNYRFIIAEQMLELGIENPILLLEPVGRNTAPAIALVAHLTQQLYPDNQPVLLILPADHLINEVHIFADAVSKALTLANKSALVTFGIKPDYPETGYGYINSGEKISESFYKIAKFVEKPDQKTAEQYCQTGEYYWNSGMFLFSAASYLAELNLYRPDIANACQMEAKKIVKIDGFYSISESFDHCPADSIDYAVMEHTNKGIITPLNIKWSDLGSWSAFWDIIPPDENGNIIQGDVTQVDTTNCYLRSESRLIATAGVKDHIIVETADAVMVAHRDYAQSVKDLFLELKSNKRSEIEYHTLVHEEWGTIEILSQTESSIVQHIIIKPEHRFKRKTTLNRGYCLVVNETITCIKDNIAQELVAGENINISKGSSYELSNQHKVAVSLFLIELK